MHAVRMLAFKLQYPVTHAQPATDLWVLTAEVLTPHPLNPKFKNLETTMTHPGGLASLHGLVHLEDPLDHACHLYHPRLRSKM
jgi:hypothetical protein